MSLVSSANFTCETVNDNDRARGKALQRLREDAKLDQDQAGEIVGRTRVTVSRWENGYPPPKDLAGKLLKAYLDRGADIPEHLWDWVSVPRETSEPDFVLRDRRGNYGIGQVKSSADDDSWSPNPALVNKIPKRAYDVAIGYCRRLQSGGWPREEIEQIERLMIDARYAQANKRKGIELTEDEQIMLIDATWEAVKHTAAALGRQV